MHKGIWNTQGNGSMFGVRIRWRRAQITESSQVLKTLRVTHHETVFSPRRRVAIVGDSLYYKSKGDDGTIFGYLQLQWVFLQLTSAKVCHLHVQHP